MDDAFLIPTVFERLAVQVAAGPSRLTPEQKNLSRRALLALRSGVDSRNPEMIALALRLDRARVDHGLTALRPSTGRELPPLALDQLLRRLEHEFETGRLLVELERTPALEIVDERPPELPPLPPRRRERDTLSFEVRFIDEIGKAISGLEVEFAVDGELRSVTTNAAGVALIEDAKSSSASVVVPELGALEKLLEPRWEKFRRGKPPVETNSIDVVLDLDEFPSTGLKAVVSNRVVIKPPLGVLFAELLDSYGRVPHAKRKYRIDGPMQFEGTTDDQGRLFHALVFPGDYTLKLESEFDIGNGPETEVVEAPLVVLPPAASKPQLRMIGAVPRIVLSRLRGLFFETNKSFLLPATLSVFDRVRDVFRANSPAELLIVGHADTTAEPSINDPLSLERAKNTKAFLEDDVDSWLAMYETSVPEGRRWGETEDGLMLASLEDFPRRTTNEEPVRWFQRTRRLEVDGDAGPKTRRVLIQEYMALDHASLIGDDFRIESRAHGCGENFPLDDTGSDVDADPENPKADPIDRRAELFFFDTEFGIQPAPPGDNSAAGSTQYPSWRKRAILDLDVLLDGKRELLIVDEMNVPLCFEPFEIETQDGRIIPGETNAEGIALFPPGLGSRVTLRLTAMSSETTIEVGFR